MAFTSPLEKTLFSQGLWKPLATSLSTAIYGDISSFANPVYDSNNKLLSATIDGVAYTFTYYTNGLIHTIAANGLTQTYTWANGQLQSVT